MNINATFLGQLLTFGVLVWFIYRYVWPPVIGTIENRVKTISDGLAAAEAGQRQLREADARREEMVRDAREQASRIIKEGEHRKTRLLEEARAEAETEKARIIEEGRGELELERNALVSEMREKVAGLVVAGAEKILRAEVDAAKHAELIESLRKRI